MHARATTFKGNIGKAREKSGNKREDYPPDLLNRRIESIKADKSNARKADHKSLRLFA